MQIESEGRFQSKFLHNDLGSAWLASHGTILANQDPVSRKIIGPPARHKESSVAMSPRWSGCKGSNAMTVLFTLPAHSLSFAACLASSSPHAGPGAYLEYFQFSPGGRAVTHRRRPFPTWLAFGEHRACQFVFYELKCPRLPMQGNSASREEERCASFPKRDSSSSGNCPATSRPKGRSEHGTPT